MKAENEKRNRFSNDSSRDGSASKELKSILKGAKKIDYPAPKSSYEKRSDNRDYNNDQYERRGNNRYERNDNRPNQNSDGSPKRSFTSRSYGNENSSYEKRQQGGGYKPRDNNYRQRNSDNYSPDRKVVFRKRGDSESSSEGKYIETRFDNKKPGVVFRKPRSKDPNYDPNAKYSHKKRIAYQKETVDPNKPIRLNKFLANAGICSRREADEFIQAGVITVNGNVISELGTKVLPADKVMFHNQPVQSERKVYLLLNKPKDCITTSEDKHAKTTVLDIVRNACSERIYPVGRLDRNTTGVLLLTNDGDLASKLTHPKYNKKKIYHATLDRALTEADFKQILKGIDLDDFVIAADALEYVKEDSQKQVGIEIHSGQNRVVRRIFDKLGYKVMRLDRVYFAGLTKKNVPRGKYRFLTEREVGMLKMGAHE